MKALHKGKEDKTKYAICEIMDVNEENLIMILKFSVN